MGLNDIIFSVASVGRIQKRTFRRVVRQCAGISFLSSLGIILIVWKARSASRDTLPLTEKERSDGPYLGNPRGLEAVGARRLGQCDVGTCHRRDSSTQATMYCEIPLCDGKCVSPSEQAHADKVDSAFVLLDRFVTIEDPDMDDTYKLKNPFWIVVPIFGIFYMFAGLAIVCDEFFVPALECFVDEFGISMDVAGATFMAAGGSMPELFTSFLATFQESQVGFAAIVGSAVFNVLFVIAVCAIASTETLSLTWWPLARDCTCYLIALITVAIVFKVTTPDVITWPEAVILLVEYICYCSFMTKNQAVYMWVENRLQKNKVMPVETDKDGSPITREKTRSIQLQETNANFKKPSTFRKGIVQLLTANTYMYETAGIAAVTQIAGDLEETFRKLDKDKDGTLNVEEVKELLELMGIKQDSQSVKTALRRINRSGEDEITFENFKKWYITSEARIEVEINRIFTEIDTNRNGTLERDEIAKVLNKLGHHPSVQEMNALMKDLSSIPTADSKHAAEAELEEISEIRDVPSSSNPPHARNMASQQSYGSMVSERCVTHEQFEQWYFGTLFHEKKKRRYELEEEESEGEGIRLEWPEGGSKSAIAWYIFTYPLCAAMFATLPDVRTPRFQRNYKVAILEFTLSLGWIGIFSQVLFECTVVFSNTIGIPPTVAAVTLLAGGTSIPDLLSSYIVARNGEGDMAVSSSIGSNIFDVTVGLPLPWLTYSIVQGVKGLSMQVRVESTSLGLSLIVLILMLGAVITTIMCCRWRLTKTLGYVMLVLYVVFIIQDLSNQFFGPFDIF